MAADRLFGGSFPVLEKAMDLRSTKHNLIVSNIANKDTPQYKAFDLIIEDEMKKFTGKGRPAMLTRTDDGHMSGKRAPGSSVRSVEDKGSGLSFREDGNTVDMDREMAKLSKNTILYKALSQIISRKFQGLKEVISGGR